MTDFERLLQTLAAGGIEYILIGGLAANAHGAIRTTRDVDIVYARSVANLERLENLENLLNLTNRQLPDRQLPDFLGHHPCAGLRSLLLSSPDLVRYADVRPGRARD